MGRRLDVVQGLPTLRINRVTQPPEEEQDGQQEDKKVESADVTLTLVIQLSTLDVFEYDFKYVDTKGDTKTIKIDAETTGVSFDAFEQPSGSLLSFMSPHPSICDECGLCI